MFMTLVATFLAGIAAAGLVMLLNHLLGKTTGRTLPRWFTPIAAGAAMIVATISNEYGWYSTTRSNLPDEFAIVQTVESQAFYRPWTYIKPFVDRFVAVDTASIRTHDAQPEMRLADTYFYGRWAPINKISVLADCANGRRAALMDAITFEEDGTVSGADWIAAPQDDPVLTTICRG
ncbi:hypothetical protein [uncultured Shimia sp.]|uniref:hypothetical protein n=1 Tax=uncultured Shimia sp. TaxID=573152 RepID=UPI00261DA066|nr:hypothetical protein [uncultured Shimia sp.]